MIGNDVVDLDLAHTESNWQRKGYLDKIFLAHEQDYILNSQRPEISIWLLWSMKEAAYKIYNRLTLKRSFIPLRLNCSDIEMNGCECIGKVTCDENIFFTKTAVFADHIHTIAVVRPQDFQKVSQIEESIEIKKRNGIPYISGNDISAVSVSHHGKFLERIILMNS